MAADLVSLGSFSLFAVSFLLLCPHTVVILCTSIPDVSFFFFNDTSHTGLTPLHMASFQCIHPFKSPVSQYTYIVKY